MRVGFLGPSGTFSEEALVADPELAAAGHIAYRTVPEVIAAVERAELDGGLIPLENSIEGPLTVTLDTLAFSSDLLIQREIDLPVSLHLCGVPGATLDGVRRIASHPNPLEQCREWLASRLPAAELVQMASTADAAAQVAAAGDPAFASIGARRGAELNGLELLASEIEDHHDNETRFVLVGTGIPAPTGADKTSIVCFQHDDHPGSLLEILQEFAARGINLTKLDSRPNKRGLGRYCFFIDLRGHVCDDVVADCLRHVASDHADVKFLGSYPVPAQPAAPPAVVRASAQADYAGDWVEALRLQVRLAS